MPTPSLLIVPARFKTGKLYSQIPTSGAGDFTVTRNTAARRFDSAGLVASVASGIPRLDYYTSGGVTGCPALLVEPAATNGILNSADTTTSWTLGANLTSGAIDVIGVSGNNLTVGTPSNMGTNAGVLRRLSNNVALASGSTYTISFLMKKTGTHTIGGYYASITGGAAGDLAAGFNVSGSFSSGSFFTSNSTINRIRRVEQWGTDVFRCSETFTMTASGTLTTFHFAPLNAVNSSSNSASGTTMGFAAPQIELGSVPTSFIPTTTGSVTRNADVISVSGAVSGSIGQTEGVVYTQVDLRNWVASGRVLAISDGTSDARVVIQVGANRTLQAVVTAASGEVANIATASGQVNGIYKCAMAYASGDFAFYVNGNQIGTDPSGAVPACNNVALGKIETSASTNFLNDRILAGALYNTRLLNAELATLTTP